MKVSIETHYYHFDAQGVVFNMWYLAFVEQARNGYLAARGYSLEALLASGHDIQMVHAAVDWKVAIRYGDQIVVEVSPSRLGNTSFGLDYRFMVDGDVRAHASGVYVIVDGAITGKRPVPQALATLLREGLANPDE